MRAAREGQQRLHGRVEETSPRHHQVEALAHQRHEVQPARLCLGADAEAGLGRALGDGGGDLAFGQRRFRQEADGIEPQAGLVQQMHQQHLAAGAVLPPDHAQPRPREIHDTRQTQRIARCHQQTLLAPGPGDADMTAATQHLPHRGGTANPLRRVADHCVGSAHHHPRPQWRREAGAAAPAARAAGARHGTGHLGRAGCGATPGDGVPAAGSVAAIGAGECDVSAAPGRPAGGRTRAARGGGANLVGLAALADRPARRLSGGEQQRLALARVAATQPEVMFLDEPGASLDPGATRKVEEIVAALAARGTKIVMTAHDLGHAFDTS